MLLYLDGLKENRFSTKRKRIDFVYGVIPLETKM